MSDSTTNLTVKEGTVPAAPGSSRLLPHPDSHNIIFYNGADNQEVMRITADRRLVKGPGLSDDAASILFFDSCKKVFWNAADELSGLRAEADDLRKYLNEEISTNSELGDELMAERATFAEFKLKTWEDQRTLRAERDKLLGFYTEIVRELGDDLVVKRFKELRAELATQKVQNNYNWQFQEISEEALKRAEAAETELADVVEVLDDHNCAHIEGVEPPLACNRVMRLAYRAETAEAKLSGMRAAVIEACKNALYRPLIWYPKGYSIDPNDLGKINEKQVNACVAAVQAVFDAGTPQEDSSK